MKKLFRNDMTEAEYIELMRRGELQRLECNLKRQKREPITAKECYHGNDLMTCESLNCQADSGRLKGGSPWKAPNAA